MNWNMSAAEALNNFKRSVRGFLSGGCLQAKDAAAMLILSLYAYRYESRHPGLNPPLLIRRAYMHSNPVRPGRSALDDLLHSWHLERRRSPAWALYMHFRDNPPSVRHATLSLLVGGFWSEFFENAAADTVLLIEQEAAWGGDILPEA